MAVIINDHIFAAFKLAFTNTILTGKQKIQMKTPTFLVDKYRSIMDYNGIDESQKSKFESRKRNVKF